MLWHQNSAAIEDGSSGRNDEKFIQNIKDF